MSALPEYPWQALNDALAPIDPNAKRQIKDAMAAIYCTIAARPPEILQDFKEFTEENLTTGQRERVDRVLVGDIKVDSSGDEICTIRDAARLLRALEVLALEGTFYLESDLPEDLERAWVTADGQNFVIPRITPLTAIDGKPYLRRALLHHRIIPTAIVTFRVRLHRSRQMLDAAGAQAARFETVRNYGAALFPGLKATVTPSGSGFLVTGLTGFEYEALIDDHLKQARAAQCGTIVWPELTMPEASIDYLQDRIREQALDEDPDLRYLVAGSWHREADGMRNVALILDGDGEALFDVLKWAKFSMDGLSEAIVPGNEVHVLICEDEVVTFAVCKDFLNDDCDVPYRKLNVDVAIVPSMIASIGERQTLAAHAATANVMRNRFGTRTLVVAQPAVPGRTVVGKVMPFPAKPLVQGPVSVKTNWFACPLVVT